jgi:hypothetical protein
MDYIARQSPQAQRQPPGQIQKRANNDRDSAKE